MQRSQVIRDLFRLVHEDIFVWRRKYAAQICHLLEMFIAFKLDPIYCQIRLKEMRVCMMLFLFDFQGLMAEPVQKRSFIDDIGLEMSIPEYFRFMLKRRGVHNTNSCILKYLCWEAK